MISEGFLTWIIYPMFAMGACMLIWSLAHTFRWYSGFSWFSGGNILTALYVGEHANLAIETACNLYGILRTLSIRIENRDPQNSLTGGVVQLISIAPMDPGYSCAPWILHEDLQINPGDSIFVPLASYAAGGQRTARDSFASISGGRGHAQGFPTIRVGIKHDLKIRVTAHDRPAVDMRCKLWVNENGQLRIKKNH